MFARFTVLPGKSLAVSAFCRSRQNMNYLPKLPRNLDFAAGKSPRIESVRLQIVA